MAETRRDVFRTSVLTAIGGLAVGAVAGCTTMQGFISPVAGTIVAICDKTSETWYLFEFVSTSDVRLFSTQPMNIGNQANIDTYTWFVVGLKSPVTDGTIRITYTVNGNAYTLTVTVVGGSLDAPSVAALRNACSGPTSNSNPVTTASWNEIGKQ